MNYGIVAEFNPFHNGHKYLIDTIKAQGNTVTAVMSGSFVQRGECACVSPYERTKMALENGVDLVLSLPVQYATASAERFAFGGVGVLGSLGVIESLGFGSECGDKDILKKCAEALLDENFKSHLDPFLKEGVSFPVARQKAISQMAGEECGSILASPNDILGVEYTKSIIKGGFSISIDPIKRIGVDHDSIDIKEDICSASALREMLRKGEDFSRYLPLESLKVLDLLIEGGKAPADFKKLEGALLYKLRSMSIDEFKNVPDVTEGIEHRIYDVVRSSSSLEEILEKTKTKRYTHSRIRRIFLCAFLGITVADVVAPVPYIRILGFNKTGAEILKQAKNKATLPIVTKSSDIYNLGDDAKRCFELECRARDIFSLSLPEADACGKEMTDKIIVL